MLKQLVLTGLCILLVNACSHTVTNPYEPKPYVKLTHPVWSKNAVLYQLNTRQFTPEGTFAAAQQQLPRLKDLGVDVIWLMPVHPIGEVNRKGSLGSPYSVKDYLKVNPELGTLDDLKAFVDKAHAHGMYVILDWVANHTAWDNPLRDNHPEWYEKDYKGDFRPTPWWDWSDIINLDYRQPALREYMTKALKYWVEEVDVDGFRCDVAGFVPIDFWAQVRRELDAIKPVLMLAEWESRDLHAEAFDITYAWSWSEKMRAIVKGESDVNALFVYYSWNESAFPREAYRMVHVANHDTNAWEGTMYEHYGNALPAVITLSVIGEGFPMMYNGQEAGNDRRLAFFERDPIDWQPHPIGDLYQRLFKLKHDNKALWNGQFGGRMIKVPNNHGNDVLSFVREKDGDKIFAAFNFSNEPKTLTFAESLFTGSYIDWDTGEPTVLSNQSHITLPAWGYKIWVK